MGGSHGVGSVLVDVAVGESDCAVVNAYTPTLHNTHGPSAAIHRGDGQISGGSHVFGSVPVDVAVGESDCGAVNAYTPTLHNTHGPSAAIHRGWAAEGS